MKAHDLIQNCSIAHGKFEVVKLVNIYTVIEHSDIPDDDETQENLDSIIDDDKIFFVAEDNDRPDDVIIVLHPENKE